MGKEPTGTGSKLRKKSKALAPEAEQASLLAAPPAEVITCESCIRFTKPYCTRFPPTVHVMREVVDMNANRLVYKDRLVSAYPTCTVDVPCGEHKKK